LLSGHAVSFACSARNEWGLCISDQRNVLLVGGTGFLGKQMARRLIASGHRVTISTRDPRSTRPISSLISLVEHDVVPTLLSSFDVVVVLSVINNNVAASPEAVQAVNVAYPVSLARMLARVPGKVLVTFGSAHADDASRVDAYSLSKRKLREALEKVEGVALRHFIIPPAYGDDFVRKLRAVDRLPHLLRSLAVTVIGALKPLVHIDRIVAQVELEMVSVPPPGFQIHRIADDQARNPIYSTVTRASDLLLSAIVLVGLSWLMILIAALIRLESRGPALFRQERVGQHGKVFTCYKFRTMHVGTPQVATHEVSRGLTTRVGRSLRRWKFDELPQIINIFMNQMSWVGPRPNLPVQKELTEERQKRGVLAAKPGITGLAQVRGIDMSDPVYLSEADAEFLFLRSLPLYYRLLLQTFLGRGMGDRIR
jgi:lipopolysaccharide/colanic/teichoic acid biosynthesis glycosyltransferase